MPLQAIKMLQTRGLHNPAISNFVARRGAANHNSSPDFNNQSTSDLGDLIKIYMDSYVKMISGGLESFIH